MNERLPFVLSSHTGSPVGYSEVAALLFRSLLEIGVEVHYCSLSEDFIYEQPSYYMVVNAMRNIEPERHLPWLSLCTAPLFWLNGGDYKIGFTMMEVDRISERWVRACNSMMRSGCRLHSKLSLSKRAGLKSQSSLSPLRLTLPGICLISSPLSITASTSLGSLLCLGGRCVKGGTCSLSLLLRSLG